jgi:hypothetical protein
MTPSPHRSELHARVDRPLPGGEGEAFDRL